MKSKRMRMKTNQLQSKNRLKIVSQGLEAETAMVLKFRFINRLMREIQIDKILMHFLKKMTIRIIMEDLTVLYKKTIL